MDVHSIEGAMSQVFDVRCQAINKDSQLRYRHHSFKSTCVFEAERFDLAMRWHRAEAEVSDRVAKAPD